MIMEMDGAMVRGCKIEVNRARYTKEANKKENLDAKSMKGTNNGGEEDQNAAVEEQSKSKEQEVDGNRVRSPSKECSESKEQEVDGNRGRSPRVVKGETNEEAVEWLKRSIIGLVSTPTSLGVIENRLMKDWRNICRVRDVGDYKFVVTFDTTEDLEDALRFGKSLLLETFLEVEEWMKNEVCETRRVWLECVGLPLHGWSEENMRRIGREWGGVLMVNETARSGMTFSSFKVRVETKHMSFINDRITIELNGRKYTLHVREVEYVESVFGEPKKRDAKWDARDIPIEDESESESGKQTGEDRMSEAEDQKSSMQRDEVAVEEMEDGEEGKGEGQGEWGRRASNGEVGEDPGAGDSAGMNDPMNVDINSGVESEELNFQDNMEGRVGNEETHREKVELVNVEGYGRVTSTVLEEGKSCDLGPDTMGPTPSVVEIFEIGCNGFEKMGVVGSSMIGQNIVVGSKKNNVHQEASNKIYEEGSSPIQGPKKGYTEGTGRKRKLGQRGVDLAQDKEIGKIIDLKKPKSTSRVKHTAAKIRSKVIKTKPRGANDAVGKSQKQKEVGEESASESVKEKAERNLRVALELGFRPKEKEKLIRSIIRVRRRSKLPAKLQVPKESPSNSLSF